MYKSIPCSQRRGEPEYEEQCRVFIFLRSQAHKHRAFHLPFATPNGFYATAYEKEKQKAAGLQNGVWDIYCPATAEQVAAGCAGAFIEMKIKPNSLTPSQSAFRARHYNCAGDTSVYRWAVCYTWIEAARFIVDFYGISDAQFASILKG